MTSNVLCIKAFPIQGAWKPATRDISNEYVEVDLSCDHIIESIVTQGRSDYGNWVKEYTVQYAADGVSGFTDVVDFSGSTVYFTGNRYM